MIERKFGLGFVGSTKPDVKDDQKGVADWLTCLAETIAIGARHRKKICNTIINLQVFDVT